VAFCAQDFIETCVSELLALTSPVKATRMLVMSGGCFYNVKLNRRLSMEYSRAFPHPLAGDQGAALGFTPGLACDGLLWGARTIGMRHGLPSGCVYVNPHSWVDIAADHLNEGRVVNVVKGNMEFGPRALCNTTTFAWPTSQSVAAINALNERDEAMPMAPVIARKHAKALLSRDELYRIEPADRFMITTVSLRNKPSPSLRGIAHPDPLDPNLWTARPQVVDKGSDEWSLLDRLATPCLINTSFNYHGEPIAMTEDDACTTHEKQYTRADLLKIHRPVTLLVMNI
jgi:carbamoyltransferase